MKGEHVRSSFSRPGEADPLEPAPGRGRHLLFVRVEIMNNNDHNNNQPNQQ